jgi:DNA-binding NarL/FixJ family response regulator
MANVLLCTDEPILAEGLDAEGLNLIACCPWIEDMGSQTELHRPDILLVDLTAGITFSVLSSLREAKVGAKVILWVHSISTELALQAISLGVRGVMRKTLSTELLLRCLMRVNEGEMWFEPALTESFITARRYSLTRREGQLVTLLTQGLKNKEIATALIISEGTVKVYLSRLFQKLGVKDRFELALYGLRNLTPGGGVMANTLQDAQKTPTAFREPPRSFFVENMPVPSQPERRPLRTI